MAARLVEAGHDVAVWNRSPDRTAPLVELGARRAATPAEAAEGSEFVFTMLADPTAVDEVLFGSDGVAGAIAPGAVVVEMSTVGRSAVRAIADRLPPGVVLVDAPVLGSVPQATEGTLKIFVGGDEATVARCQPLLAAMGTPRRLGSLGAGAAMKLVANSTLGALMCGLAEALALADALGLEQQAVLDVLVESPIGVTARSKRPLIESGEYPANFKLALAAKDLGLVTAAADEAGLALRLAPAARAWLEEAAAAGLGELDYSAVVAHARGAAATDPSPA
jgi:3-hydroxyisobutyrate dehydrogenase-like beta-hydroxyacid dehydrogenase